MNIISFSVFIFLVCITISVISTSVKKECDNKCYIYSTLSVFKTPHN